MADHFDGASPIVKPPVSSFGVNNKRGNTFVLCDNQIRIIRVVGAAFRYIRARVQPECTRRRWTYGVFVTRTGTDVDNLSSGERERVLVIN